MNTQRDELARTGMIHLAERYGTRLRLEPSQNNEIRVDVTHSGGMESHFPNVLDLLESVEAVAEHMGARKPRTVDNWDHIRPTQVETVIRDARGNVFELWEHDEGQFWMAVGEDYLHQEPELPITVLFTPGGE